MEIKDMHDFLVESALLTHGLSSISNKEILEIWPSEAENIAWIQDGFINIGSIENYLPFRIGEDSSLRIDSFHVEEAVKNKLSGALTASGTMKVCSMLGISMAVSCGIGGIGDIRAERICPDLPALADIPVYLLCTSFKDMIYIEESIKWLNNRNVEVKTMKGNTCTGYLFNSADVAIPKLETNILPRLGHGLILNPISFDKRIKDNSLLEIGIKAGKKAEETGEYYHPAVNRTFDELTKGQSSRVQLEALVENVKKAETFRFI